MEIKDITIDTNSYRAFKKGDTFKDLINELGSKFKGFTEAVFSGLPTVVLAEIIRDEKRANYILLRGFAVHPNLPSYQDAYGLNAACIATYPMYRGVAKLVGIG